MLQMRRISLTFLLNLNKMIEAAFQSYPPGFSHWKQEVDRIHDFWAKTVSFNTKAKVNGIKTIPKFDIV